MVWRYGQVGLDARRKIFDGRFSFEGVCMCGAMMGEGDMDCLICGDDRWFCSRVGLRTIEVRHGSKHNLGLDVEKQVAE